jgi:hypothetical protein
VAALLGGGGAPKDTSSCSCDRDREGGWVGARLRAAASRLARPLPPLHLRASAEPRAHERR